ncbi:unnamed protein product, partial [Polarella glacialis]
VTSFTMSKKCNGQNIFLAKEASRKDTEMVAGPPPRGGGGGKNGGGGGGGGGSMRGWGGGAKDNFEDDYEAPRGNKGRARAPSYDDGYHGGKGGGKSWEDVYAAGYAAAAKGDWGKGGGK